MKYVTMTVGGMYGPAYEGSTPEEAAERAEAAGEDVLDIVELDDETVLVVAE